jgi:CubicO group peptidase (beta-lactamase class C family)
MLLTVTTAAYGQKNRTDDIAEAIVAVEEGRFADAEALLAPCMGVSDAPVIDECAVLREQMRRIRHDYRQTSAEMLEKLRRSIPDVAADDVERWRLRGELQHRVIDGNVRYFVREPSNLFRFCDEAKARRVRDVPPASASFDLPRHIEHLLSAADAASAAEVYPVRHHVRYTLRVRDGHPRIQPGATVRCWLPYPQEYRQQRDVRLVRTEPAGGVVASNGVPQRTVYFEQVVEDAGELVAFAAEFEFVTSAYCPQLNPALAELPDRNGELYREFTAERSPHIVFTPEIRRIADKVAGSEPNPLLKAKRLFRWVCENVRYCAEMEYSTIFNLSDKAVTTRRGDCGVQALLFITLCRAAGVPARWQSGWETQPIGWNMHDWAEFYVAPWGWLPADPSYGLQAHHDPRVREFYCGGMDPYRMIVNLDYARELHPRKTSFRSEPNDFQRGEVEIDGHNLYFDEWRWSFELETMPLDRSLTAAAEALDAIVPALLEAEKIPGAVLLVGRRADAGFERVRRSYGYMQIEPSRVAMPVDAIFDMASMTKPIATGTSLAILLDRGDIGLDEPVGKYLPEFAGGDKARVTLRHLVTHMSGAAPYLGASDQKPLREEHGFPCSAAMHAAVREHALSGEPGAQVRYSCLNAILAADIVEKVSGTTLDRFAAENIFQPLGMSSSTFNPDVAVLARCVPTTKAAHGNGAGGFLRGQVHDPMAAMLAGVSGNAGLFSTADDVATFAEMLLAGGARGDVRILKAGTVKLISSPQNAGSADRRGVLWDIYGPNSDGAGVDALYAYGHTGYTGTAIRIYPEQGYYVIALTNRVHPDDSGKVSEFRKAVWRTVGEALLGVN